MDSESTPVADDDGDDVAADFALIAAEVSNFDLTVRPGEPAQSRWSATFQRPGDSRMYFEVGSDGADVVHRVADTLRARAAATA